MSRRSVLKRGRRAAEGGMNDTCIIRRVLGDPVTDEFSGEITTNYLEIYAGKCRFQQVGTSQAEEEDVGQAYVLMQRMQVQLPVAVMGLQVDDEITVTDAQDDPDLIGRVFLVNDLARKSEATARRVQARERTS